jgi:uncharacterized protein (TIGR02145 family)
MNYLIKLRFCIAFIFLTSIFISCKKYGDTPSDKTTAIFNTSKTYGTMTDQDGNVYKTITIGTQTWMAENLRSTKYNDGSSITNVSDNIAWESMLTGAYCNYKDTTNVKYIVTNGRLYNWYALNKIAPNGWHVPSIDEFKTLINYLGGETEAGGLLKEIGLTHWNSSNIGATNESGFTALPSGYRGSLGYAFEGRGKVAGYWTTKSDADYSYAIILRYSNKSALTYVFGKYFGMSVRLIKD